MEIGGSSKALDVSALREDLEYMRASNVNVSNFVSVKLSGTSNYKIWKEQMLCLIKSQALLYIVDAGCPSPGDKGVNPQYDQLVKGWIFGSVNEKVFKDLVGLGTAQEVWIKLESLFNLPAVSDTEGDLSNAPDAIGPVVYATREDLKYLQALNVDVSNFVSEKLVDKRNYYTWKNEMLCLIRSHELLHIIHDKARLPWNEGDPMTQKYDSLVRGWILNTMNEDRRDEYRIYRSVQLMWRNLESTFTYQSKTSDSEAGDTKDETQDLKYMEASNVNLSNFVLVNLSNDNNYSIWKAQMLYLLECHNLLHIITLRYSFQEEKYQKLVKGWILCTMSDELAKEFPEEDYVFKSAKDLWEIQESRFGYSRPEPVVSASTQDLKYTLALNVNVSNFVSVKLSGRSNYKIWKGQMLYLIESQRLLHIIDKEDKYNVDKYDTLVKGWIFSTMNEQLLNDLTYTDNLIDTCYSATYVWKKLNSALDRQDRQEVEFGIEFITNDTKSESDHPESDNTDKKRWYKAVAEGWWRKAQSIFKINKNAATEATTANNVEIVRDTPDIKTESSRIEYIEDTLDVETGTSTTDVNKELYEAAAKGRWRKAKSILRNSEIPATKSITTNGDTLLHVAVERGQNYFVEELLGFLKNGKDIEKKNGKGRTALHIAAMVGNTQAAQLLVLKREELLVIEDDDRNSPLMFASQYTNLDTYAYLFRPAFRPSCSDNLSGLHTYGSQKDAILAAIFSKQYDLVGTLLKELEEIVLKYPLEMPLDHHKEILMAITISYPSDIGFMKSFIYPSFQNVLQETIVRGSLLFHLDICIDDILRVVKICNNMCCSWLWKNSIMLLVMIATPYLIYQLIYLFLLVLRLPFSMLYFLLWKILAFIVRPIKNIEKKKKEYKDAKKILRLVCNQMSNSDIVPTDALFEAVRLDIYEVVDEILFTSPAIINCKDNEGYNIIQSSILNRAEKVYNLIYHLIERTKSHREMTDSFSNNLCHLAGKLAPSFVLDRTSGAALQLQREVLWFEEVSKLVLPLQLKEKNIYKETPKMVFRREHHDLQKQGETWIKTTAESCSITAALIITVVFAAAITVPGGSNQESGIPLFKKETTFIIFAVSNALSWFTACAALLLFFSTRFSEKDFLLSLPTRFIFGLFNLLLSTISMIVAFCAILLLVFCDQSPLMLAPICTLACLPILVIATVELSLLVEMIQSTYSPIVGEKSYLESCKVNKKNTIFTK